MWKNRGFGKNNSSNFRGKSRGFGKDRRGPIKTFNKRHTSDRVRSSQGVRKAGRFSNDRNLVLDTDRNRPIVYEDGRQVIDRESNPRADVHSFDSLYKDKFSPRDEYRAGNSDRYVNHETFSPNLGHVKDEDQYLERRNEFDNVGRESGFNNLCGDDDYRRGVDLKYDRPFTDYVTYRNDGAVNRRSNDELLRDDNFSNDNYQHRDNVRNDYKNTTGNRNDRFDVRESNYGSHNNVRSEIKTEHYDDKAYKSVRTDSHNTDRNRKRSNFDRENKSDHVRHSFDMRVDAKSRRSDLSSNSGRDHTSKDGRNTVSDHRSNIPGSENDGKLYNKRSSSATVSENRDRKTDNSGRSNSSGRQKDNRSGTKSHSANNEKYSKGRGNSHGKSTERKTNSDNDRRRSSLSKTSDNNKTHRDSSKKTETKSAEKHGAEDKKRSMSGDKKHRSGGSHSKRDSFKKPAERQQSNTTNRSNSGRRTETNTGHYNEDDILSIMADDDGFDIEHRFGNSNTRTASPRRSARDSTGKNISSSRSSRDNYQRPIISEPDRSAEPFFEIHADSSASIFDEHTDRVENYGNIRRQSSIRGHSKDRKSDNRNMKNSPSKSSDRSRHDRHIGKKSEQSSKVNHVSITKSEPGCIRHELGKTGALLREDRSDDTVSKVGSRFQSQRQNRNFKSGSKGSFVSKPRFSNRNLNYSDRLKRKYLRGGLRGKFNDRDSYKHKGYHGRDNREKRGNIREKRDHGRNSRSDRDNRTFINMSDNADDGKGRFNNFVDSQGNSQQQIVFIPNTDLEHGLPPMVDQFGQAVYNTSMADPSIEGQMAMRYMPEQYPADASAVGEHLVFIPFVNQVPNYPENISNIPDNNVVNEVKIKEEKSKSFVQTKPKPKPLSDLKKLAIKRKLAQKRKQQLEAEIERKLLKKLLGNKEIVKAVKEQSSNQMKKKPVIRRISPPGGNKPTHANKTIKLVKKVDNVIVLSDEEGDKYDSVSDLEDVSDDDEFEDRKGKRPTFRKPGEPRKGTRSLAESRPKVGNVTERKETDVRRVVQASSRRSWEQTENSGQKRHRSMYSDEQDNYGETNRSPHSLARSSVKKVRRSRSPIEITVSNERYSSTVGNSQRNTSDKDRKTSGYRNTELRNEGQGSRGRVTSGDGDHKYDSKRYGGFDGQDRSDGSRIDRHQREDNNRPNKFESHTNTRHIRSGSENSNDRNYNTGKYDKFTERGRNDMSRNRNDEERTTVGLNEKSSDDRGFGYRNQSGNYPKDYDGGEFQSPRIPKDYHVDNSQAGESSSHFNSPSYQRSYQSNQNFSQSPDDRRSFSSFNSVQHQFTATGGVDHSLPPVQNAPVALPPYPPVSMGVGPDMSLPPPVGGNSPMMHPSNTGNIQQNLGVQSQQQYQSIHQQYPQQQQQLQVINPNQSQYQIHQQQQPVFTSGHNQISVQQIQPNQFQQTQSSIGIVPLNQSQVSGHGAQQMSAPVRHLNQSNFKQVINTSNNQHAFVATNSQGVRGVIGTLKTSGTGSQQGLRMAQVETGPSRSDNISDGLPSLLRLSQDDEAYFENLVQMICSKCNSVLLDHTVMKSHGRWHDMIENNNKHLRCDQCEQGFPTAKVYNHHMSVKHTYHSWNCSLCDLTFSNSSALNKHIRHTSHKNFKVKFVCSLCPASFMVLTHLVQHKKDSHQSDSTYSAFKKF